MVPAIWIEPVNLESDYYAGCYRCPLYKTTVRAGELTTTGHSTNFVRYLDFPTKVPTEHWVRRGAALFTQLDY